MNKQIYDAVRLTHADAARAYGAFTLLKPDVTLDEWFRFVGMAVDLNHSDKGIFALRDRRGCSHGLFTYRVDRALGVEATLKIAEIASLRLPGSVLIKTLIRFADDLATEFALPSIAIEMQPCDMWGEDRHVMELSGFKLDRVTMRGSARHAKGASTAG